MSTLCADLHALLRRLPRHRFPFDVAAIPRNGIYVLFEDGERAHGGDRIVRVGTHTGANQLRSRLQQHFVKENKDRSIFRKNIGRALLNRAGDRFLAQWDIDLTTRRAREAVGLAIDRHRLAEVEALVSAYIRAHLSFVVLRVDDKAERLALESRIISTVSRCNACGPSPNWLGFYSPKDKIRLSGLWLVNELWKEPLTPADLARVAALCAATASSR